MGKSCEIIEDYAAACDYYSKALSFDLDPELAYVQAMVVSYGNALLRTGRQETALGFESIYDAFSPLADFVYLMGNIYKQNQMYEQAFEQYQKAIGIPLCRLEGANSFLPVYQTGEICEILGDIPAAISCYQQCGSFAPAVKRLEFLQKINS